LKDRQVLSLDNWQAQLRKGLLDIAVLNLLNHNQLHGYEMVQTLKRSHGLRIHEGNIYPILARLKADGLVTTYTKASPEGPPRKYFRLTELGRKTLADMNTHWDQIIQTLGRFRKGGHK
jgi:PadR family transcriptional regulator PadR